VSDEVKKLYEIKTRIMSAASLSNVADKERARKVYKVTGRTLKCEVKYHNIRIDDTESNGNVQNDNKHNYNQHHEH
jgi:hypothetical protein